MVSRATHYNNKKRHAQREFGVEKPKLVSKDQSTAWLTEAVQWLQAFPVDEFFNFYQITLNAPLTEVQLRELSKRGILRMRAYRDPDTNKFVEYQWALDPSALLA